MTISGKVTTVKGLTMVASMEFNKTNKTAQTMRELETKCNE